jgi:phosphatidate cytidylyltransferase
MDWKMPALMGGVLTVLAAATAVGQLLKRQPDSGLNSAAVQTFNSRMRAYWLMCSLLAASILLGTTTTVVLFGLIAFWALREFITLTPTRPGDHRALFWIFFLFTPAQFVMIAWQLYDVYSVLIPVYAFLFVLARVAFSGDYKRFLERTAKIQAGCLICVYCLSHAPALMYLKPNATSIAVAKPIITPPSPVTTITSPVSVDLDGQKTSDDATSKETKSAVPSTISPETTSAATAKTPVNDPHLGARLLFYFVLIVQLADAMQYLSGKLFGRHVIAPTISPNKTWEGLLGAVGATTLVGTALYWATPFQIWQAAIMSFVIALMGFAGSITMSAIKRDRGVKDYGTLVEGHSGVLDRIDSICFAAPVCFHLSRLFLS